MCPSPPIRRPAISLVEVVISTMLVGSMVVGSLSMLGASVTTQQEASNAINGPRLANALLYEIMSVPYEDPQDTTILLGTESGESTSSRADFDDVDDYHNWSGSPVQSKDGTVRPDAAGWTRTARVFRAKRDDGDVGMFESGLKRFIVTVTSPTGEVTERRGMRSQWGPLEQPPTIDKVVVTQIQSCLTLGTRPVELHRTTNLLNHVRDPNAN